MDVNIKKMMEELGNLLPKGLVPDSYIDYLIEDNMDFADSEEEVCGNVKMQLFEETGVELPLSRKEAEEYLCDELSDNQWLAISKDEVTTSQQIKILEDADEKTIYDLLKELPLIPCARVISGLMTSYMENHGMEISDERAEEITEDLIHMLGMPFNEMSGNFDDDDDDDDDYDDLVFEFDDDDDEDDDEMGNLSEILQERLKSRGSRRSRISQFPRKKD